MTYMSTSSIRFRGVRTVVYVFCFVVFVCLFPNDLVSAPPPLLIIWIVRIRNILTPLRLKIMFYISPLLLCETDLFLEFRF